MRSLSAGTVVGRSRWAVVLIAFSLLAGIVGAASAAADETQVSAETTIPSSAIERAIEEKQDLASQLTDSQAAAELPHQDLGRDEALELMQGVFAPELRSPAGPFDDLHVEKFLSAYSAVIGAGEQPKDSGIEVGGDRGGKYEGPTVIESTLPLRTEGASGEEEAVDLSLEHAEGELQPSAPLVEVGIPDELGDGIEIPATGITVELAGAPPDRHPSTIEQSVAAFPNVAQDTDLAVAPTPTGVETLTDLRSADAPTSQTFHLNLPSGASLEADGYGGAVVTNAQGTLLRVLPPSAIDANGANVPVSLEVSGDSFTLQVSPDSSTAFPVLVDPTYSWWSGAANFADWSNEKTTSAITLGTQAACSLTCPWSWLEGHPKGLDVLAAQGATVPNEAQGKWISYVPRWESDLAEYGARPQSFIASMTLQEMVFWTGTYSVPGDTSQSPALVNGIWDSVGSKYASMLFRWGNEQLGERSATYVYGYGGDENSRLAIADSFWSGATHTMSANREAYIGQATLEFGDNNTPTIGSLTAPSGWMNATASPIAYSATDLGLGVSSFLVKIIDAPGAPQWSTSVNCASTYSNPCPHTIKSTDSGAPALKYEPSTLPQGTFTAQVTAKDPVAHASATSTVPIKIDHTVPKLALSGTLTEQATVGTTQPTYSLKVVATDGAEGAPQSGAASTTTEVDGKVVDSTSPGCATQNCSITREWTLEAAAYAAGHHTVKVTASDGVGLKTSKELDVWLGARQPPTVTTEAATGLTESKATLHASVNPNGLATTYQFEYGTTTSYGTKIPASPESVGSGYSAVAVAQAVSGLKEGTTYHYRVVATNSVGTATGADRTLTTIQLPQTTITSPQPSYTSREEPPITFTSSQSGSTFKCGLDASPTTSCTSPYKLPEHLSAGWHTFEVVATNSAGYTDPTSAKWTFNTAIYPPAPTTSKLISPEEGSKSSSYYTLKAEWGSPPKEGGVTGVTFEYKAPEMVQFETIPAKYVENAAGNQVTWPLAVKSNPGESESVYLDARDFHYTVRGHEGWGEFNLDGNNRSKVEFRAIFDGSPEAAGASVPVTTEFSKRWGAPQDATEGVGPVNLDLLTGGYTISRSDVSIPVPGTEASLEFTRVYESNYVHQKVPTQVLGGAWQPSAPVEIEAEGEAWTELVERHEDAVAPVYAPECWEEHGEKECESVMVEEEIPAANWIEIVDNEGAAISFEIVGGNYVAPEYLKEYALTAEGAGEGRTFTLSDPQGSHTVFSRNGPEDEFYRPTSVSWQATPKSSRMVYEHVEGTDEYRLTEMIGPAPEVECTDKGAMTKPGCRSLTFEYTEGKFPNEDRLAKITYHNATGIHPQTVAQYAYDSSGRLIKEWDPRILPAQTEEYAYSSYGENRLISLTPPGEKPWSFSYYHEERQ